MPDNLLYVLAAAVSEREVEALLVDPVRRLAILNLIGHVADETYWQARARRAEATLRKIETTANAYLDSEYVVRPCGEAAMPTLDEPAARAVAPVEEHTYVRPRGGFKVRADRVTFFVSSGEYDVMRHVMAGYPVEDFVAELQRHGITERTARAAWLASEHGVGRGDA